MAAERMTGILALLALGLYALHEHQPELATACVTGIAALIYPSDTRAPRRARRRRRARIASPTVAEAPSAPS